MPRITIDNKIVINFDSTAREKYWKNLSEYLINKHGNQIFDNQQKVDEMLTDSFSYLVQEFRSLVLKEKRYSFFLYVFWLHEQSIEIYIGLSAGLKLTGISANEFAMYRRILKLILEQGCDIDLDWGKLPTGNEVVEFDKMIQELIYLGTWMYGFADYIAYQKMIEECHKISFDDKGLLVIEWQHHYGVAYTELVPTLVEDYKQATFDEQAVHELRANIEECFNIEYDFAGGIIWEIQKSFSTVSPDLETIEPHVLPINLVHQFGINQETAEIFYNGLTISRANKLTIENAILKPHSTQRYLFRPILIYKIGGVDRALIGKGKFSESIMVLATNAIHWNAMLEDWLKLKCIKLFINKKGDDHDKILEDKIEVIVKQRGLYYCRNVKSFKQPQKNNIRIDNELAGEIDLIIVDINRKHIFVADAKYNRARYEAVGYRTDYTNFIKTYEPQLQRKIDWISNNLDILQEHLKIIYNTASIALQGYQIEGIFIINTPTFYMFNGQYKAITLKQFTDFIEGKYEYPNLVIISEENDKKVMVKHPYFIKP